MFRRECYEEGGGMDEDPRLRGTEDAEYCARLVSRYTIHRLRTVLAHYRLASLASPSLSLSVMSENNEKSWKLTAVLEEKGLLSGRDVRRRRSFLYYEQARFNLHLLHRPFRRLLLKSILAGYPSWQALVTFSLCFLPGPVLSRLLMGLLAFHNRVKQRRFGVD